MPESPLFDIAPTDLGEDPEYLHSQLIPCFGNQQRLLPVIGLALRQVQAELGTRRLRLLELCSGPGAVARYFKRYASVLHVNDVERYSRVVNSCYLTNASTIHPRRLADALAWLELEMARKLARKVPPGLMAELAALKDGMAARKLDTARQAIELLPADLQPYFLAPLLAQATAAEAEVKVELPRFSRFEGEYVIHQQDATALVRTLPEVDLAYFDPPDNQPEYGANCFRLNLLAGYQRPGQVSEGSCNRSRKLAAATRLAVIEECPAKFVLLSCHAGGLERTEEFKARLSKLGRVTVCETAQPLTCTERLYLLRKH